MEEQQLRVDLLAEDQIWRSCKASTWNAIQPLAATTVVESRIAELSPSNVDSIVAYHKPHQHIGIDAFYYIQKVHHGPVIRCKNISCGLIDFTHAERLTFGY